MAMKTTAEERRKAKKYYEGHKRDRLAWQREYRKDVKAGRRKVKRRKTTTRSVRRPATRRRSRRR